MEPSAHLFTRATERDWGKLSSAITRALRTAGPKFGQRALRRGALQTIAADPQVSLETLRTFSGHTNDEMLLRYLNWGLQANGRAAEAQKAAENLFPQAAPAEPPAIPSDDDTHSTTSSTEQPTRATTSPSFARRH
jgi:hypothetical protein